MFTTCELYPFPVFLLSVAVVALLIRLATRLHWMDIPDGRKVHTRPMPCIGGVAMCVVFVLAVLLLPYKPQNYEILLVSIILLTLVGLYDDLRGIDALKRFLFQTMVVLFIVLTGNIRIDNLGDLLNQGFDIHPYTYMVVLITVLAGVGLINAFNMIDGLDGLAGGLALIATVYLLVAWCAVPGVLNCGSVGALLVFAMTILGFLMFNMRFPWHTRACVFMGDAGSTMLGAVLLWFLVHYSQVHASRAAMIEPITAVWFVLIPLIDTWTVMIRRLVDGQNPFVADRRHIHHLLINLGYSDSQTTARLLAVAVITGAIGFSAYQFHTPEAIQLVVLCLIFLVYYVVTGYFWAQWGCGAGCEAGEKQRFCLRRILTLRFGKLPAWVDERLANAEPAQESRWIKRTSKARKIDAVFADD